jgi:hypothetical protein
MKVFLLSDLVVHELVSMQLEGQWLTSEQFSESARLWMSRNGSKSKLSEELSAVLQNEAIRIVERLMQEVEAAGQESPLKTLLLDIPAVNYADPMSASALAASLEVCRSKLCDCCTQPGKPRETEARWRCHPALRLLLCGTSAPQEPSISR